MLRPSMRCRVAILAGGKGTRLAARTGGLPKPMTPILGKPVLEHQIELCKQYGFSEIALLVHYKSEAIEAYFGDGSKWGVSLVYVQEQDARGTAGALRDALYTLADRFLVLYADTYARVDLSRLWDFHSQSDAAGTLLLHPNDHPQDSDLVALDSNGCVTGIHPYPHAAGVDHANLVNAALYVLRRDALEDVIPAEGLHDLAKHTFPALLAKGRTLCGYVTPEYIKDMGTPARLDKVERDITVGLPERLSGDTPRYAVFLDRDGTLNHEVNHLNHPDQLQLFPGVTEAVHRLNRAGLLAIGVTNQPVVARGELTLAGLAKVHARLDTLLGAGGAYLDGMFVCHHHPDRGFEGEVAELKVVCSCRKPEPGMLNQATAQFNIDRRQSWMVGDTTSDILAGRRAGVRTILVRTGYGGRDYKYDVSPDFIADKLTDAIDWILAGHGRVTREMMPVAAAYANQRMILVGGASKTGKTSAANVLKELLEQAGRTTHVISLDGWLRSPEQRPEQQGVLHRYDVDTYRGELLPLVGASTRIEISQPVRDRISGEARGTRRFSVGPDDVIVVEGVTALLDDVLLSLTDARVMLCATEERRRARFVDEYLLRGAKPNEIDEKFASRELDEVAPIDAAGHAVAFQISL
ncbi:HAD-IIIA family hydrolase [Pandoraea apista]|nr:HAD-IIIA family hydrolase [Pandoraea apista]